MKWLVYVVLWSIVIYGLFQIIKAIAGAAIFFAGVIHWRRKKRRWEEYCDRVEEECERVAAEAVKDL